MFETLIRIYNGGKGPLTFNGLKKAVGRGWLTADEYRRITGKNYSE